MTTIDDERFKRLIEKADAPTPPKWDHKEGDVLIGTVLELGTYEGEYGKSKTVAVECAEGSTEQGEPIKVGYACTFYASRTVAASKLEKALARGLRAGDAIVIRAKGYVDGKAYFDYGLAFEPGAQLSVQDESPQSEDDDVPF
jgi:hypothetical protein